MGVDIHMMILKRNGTVVREIFDGRNSEWFDNLQNRGWSEEYDELPIKYGLPENADPVDNGRAEKGSDYYGFHWITVGDFREWFETYRPNVDAGWVTTYEKFKYEVKHIVPEVRYALSPEDILADMHFIQIVNRYDCSQWLYTYTLENRLNDEDIIYYYFDC